MLIVKLLCYLFGRLLFLFSATIMANKDVYIYITLSNVFPDFEAVHGRVNDALMLREDTTSIPYFYSR